MRYVGECGPGWTPELCKGYCARGGGTLRICSDQRSAHRTLEPRYRGCSPVYDGWETHLRQTTRVQEKRDGYAQQVEPHNVRLCQGSNTLSRSRPSGAGRRAAQVVLEFVFVFELFLVQGIQGIQVIVQHSTSTTSFRVLYYSPRIWRSLQERGLWRILVGFRYCLVNKFAEDVIVWEKSLYCYLGYLFSFSKMFWTVDKVIVILLPHLECSNLSETKKSYKRLPSLITILKPVIQNVLTSGGSTSDQCRNFICSKPTRTCLCHCTNSRFPTGKIAWNHSIVLSVHSAIGQRFK